MPGASHLVALTCGGGDPALPRPHDMTEPLRSIADIIADEMDIIAEVILHDGKTAPAAIPEEVREEGVPRKATLVSEAGDVTADFLLAT